MFDSQRCACRILLWFSPERWLARVARNRITIAIVAELADAHGSGPCTRKGVGVRVPSSAPDVLLNHLKSTKCMQQMGLVDFRFFPTVPKVPPISTRPQIFLTIWGLSYKGGRFRSQKKPPVK